MKFKLNHLTQCVLEAMYNPEKYAYSLETDSEE